MAVRGEDFDAVHPEVLEFVGQPAGGLADVAGVLGQGRYAGNGYEFLETLEVFLAAGFESLQDRSEFRHGAGVLSLDSAGRALALQGGPQGGVDVEP
jgi:hypothetical protein